MGSRRTDEQGLGGGSLSPFSKRLLPLHPETARLPAASLRVHRGIIVSKEIQISGKIEKITKYLITDCGG